jgi:hypothetical protein
MTEARRKVQCVENWAPLRRGWCFGDEGFHRTLLDRIATGIGPTCHGAPPAELAVHAGERIVASELSRLGWGEAELAARPKAAREKLDIAARLRRETVLSLRWIATRLEAGSPHTLRNALQARVRPQPVAAASPCLRQGRSAPAPEAVDIRTLSPAGAA